MGPEEPGDAGDENEFNTKMEAMEDGFEAWIRLPAIAELHADVSENKAPWPGAEEGIEVKAKLRHAGDASGQSDEGADDGQEAGDEDGDAAVALKVMLGAVEIVAAEEDIAAKALDGGTATPGSEPVGGEGAEIAADGSGGGYPEEIELAGVNEVAGEGHDDLGWQRNAGRFDGHKEGDTGVSSSGDDGDDEGGEGGYDSLGHVGAV